MIGVPYVNLQAQHSSIRNELLEAVDRVIGHSQFILGEEVEAFEDEFASYCGTRYAVGVASGTDALALALKAAGVGPGDEVITAPNSFLASASAIVLAGAVPRFVDVGYDHNLNPNLLEASITSRTKALLPVHLTGRPADMNPVLELARRHNLTVIEDAAQAIGAKYHGQMVGSMGLAGCFSMHPLKNLSACGDAGVITTDNESIYRYLLKARNHGLRNRDECEFWSLNSRLDALQAAILRVKLKHLDAWIAKRRANAKLYREKLGEVVSTPDEKSHEYSVYHTFVVQAKLRDHLKIFLKKNGIGTAVHYPIPIHLQEAAADLGYSSNDFPLATRMAKSILSLPIYPELTRTQIDYVADCVKIFYQTNEGNKFDA